MKNAECQIISKRRERQKKKKQKRKKRFNEDSASASEHTILSMYNNTYGNIGQYNIGSMINTKRILWKSKLQWKGNSIIFRCSICMYLCVCVSVFMYFLLYLLENHQSSSLENQITAFFDSSQFCGQNSLYNQIQFICKLMLCCIFSNAFLYK